MKFYSYALFMLVFLVAFGGAGRNGFAQEAELTIGTFGGEEAVIAEDADHEEGEESSASLFLKLQQELAKKTAVWPAMAEESDFETIIYTDWQMTLIQDALQRFREDPYGGEEVVDEEGNVVIRKREAVPPPPPPPEPGIRELELGGILYNTESDWIVWLNGMRVTPDSWPDRVIDMDVFSEYVELIWFDKYTNLVYPIRLKPHQRFNLDRRLYLPGASGK